MSRMAWGILASAVAAAVVFLILRKGPDSKPDGLVPASIPGEQLDAPRDESVPTLGRSPTIVQAKPVTEAMTGNGYIPWPDASPLENLGGGPESDANEQFQLGAPSYSESPYQQAMNELSRDRQVGGGQAAWPSAEQQRSNVLPPEPYVPSPSIEPLDSYLTQVDDSFWKISEQRYGTGAYFRALYAHNRALIARPDQLEPGIRISTPRVAELERLYPDLCPR